MTTFAPRTGPSRVVRSRPVPPLPWPPKRAPRRRSPLARRLVVVLGIVAGLVLVAARLAGPGASIGTDDAVLLVNAEHAVPGDYAPDLRRLYPDVPVSTVDVTVDDTIVEPLTELVAGAKDAGLDGLYVMSGYRDGAAQRRLWEDAADRTYVQKPGHSEHETGLAVDFADLSAGDGGFGATTASGWLADNAWRYGFVLRYPQGKEAITGISFEPWHYRYVGADVAAQLHHDGLTLEEYVSAQRS